MENFKECRFHLSSRYNIEENINFLFYPGDNRLEMWLGTGVCVQMRPIFEPTCAYDIARLAHIPDSKPISSPEITSFGYVISGARGC